MSGAQTVFPFAVNHGEVVHLSGSGEPLTFAELVEALVWPPHGET